MGKGWGWCIHLLQIAIGIVLVIAVSTKLLYKAVPTQVWRIFPFALFSGLELTFFSGVYGTSVGNSEIIHNSKGLIGVCGMFIGAGEILGELDGFFSQTLLSLHSHWLYHIGAEWVFCLVYIQLPTIGVNIPVPPVNLTHACFWPN